MKLKPVIVQDASTKEVLMLAYANEVALKKSKETGYAWYFSRERNKLWKKGKTSGNVQKIVSIKEDCDRDTLLYIVEQKGNACHKGKYSCFKKEKSFTLETLEEIIKQRKNKKPLGSYTVKLLNNPELLLKKLNEETFETISAYKKNKKELVSEVADLFYFSLVLLGKKGIRVREIYQELNKRNKNK